MSNDKKNDRGPKKPYYKNKFYWAAGGIAAMILYSIMSDGQDNRPSQPGDTPSYTDTYNRDAKGHYGPGNPGRKETIRLDSTFWDLLERHQLQNIMVQQSGSGFVVRGTLRHTHENFYFTTRDEKRLYDTLNKKNIVYTETLNSQPSIQNVSNNSSNYWSMALNVAFLGIVGFMIWNMWQQQKGGNGNNQRMNMGKSKARLLTETSGRVTFDDVAGVDEAKEELSEIVDFLKNPIKYTKLGGKMPTGALLVGPPGTGKTLMARAVAGEAGVPFFSISGSDFVEMFVGVGASRVRDMFAEAKKKSPCIIFIDEIDAIGKKRSSGAGMGGGNEEREQTLNQLLVEMDGFDTDDSVVLIAATNRPDSLDDALLRPGRFDRQVQVPKPVLDGREKILQVHINKKQSISGAPFNIFPNIDVKRLAIGTPGFSGADLANLVNESCLMAARRNSRAVEAKDFEEAKDKIMMGYRRKTQIMSPEEKTKTARHEIGHALVGLYTNPPCDPLYKVTVIPRGGSLGVTANMPEKDEVSISEDKLHSRLAMMFGGRKAEELIYGKNNITTGAANDIQQATNLARAMVQEWGFSDEVGRIRHVSQQTNPFGGAGMVNASHSEETQRLIDQEVRKIIQRAEKTAEEILTKYRKEFDLLTEFLDEHEELSGAQVAHIIEHGDLPVQQESPVMQDIEIAEPANDDCAPRSSVPIITRRKVAGSDFML